MIEAYMIYDCVWQCPQLVVRRSAPAKAYGRPFDGLRWRRRTGAAETAGPNAATGDAATTGRRRLDRFGVPGDALARLRALRDMNANVIIAIAPSMPPLTRDGLIPSRLEVSASRPFGDDRRPETT